MKKYKSLKQRVEADKNANEMNDDMKKHESVRRQGLPTASDSEIKSPKGVNCSKYFSGENVNIILDNENIIIPLKQKSKINNVDTTDGLNQEQIKEKNKLIIKNDFKPELDDWNDNLKNDYEDKLNKLRINSAYFIPTNSLSTIIHKKMT